MRVLACQYIPHARYTQKNLKRKKKMAFKDPPAPYHSEEDEPIICSQCNASISLEDFCHLVFKTKRVLCFRCWESENTLACHYCGTKNDIMGISEALPQPICARCFMRKVFE